MARNLKQALSNESARKADLEKGIIRRYLGGGIWLIKGLGCNKLFRASAGQGSRSYAPGTSVNIARIQGSQQRAIVSLPPPGRRGASAGPVLSLGSGPFDALALREAAPQAIPAGSSDLAVSLLGGGFLETPVDSVRAVRFNNITQEWDDDPFLTVNSVVWISDKQLDITVDTSPDTPVTEILTYKIWFEISRS